MRGGAKAPLPLVTRALRTLVPDWHWLRGCLLGPSVQNQASRWHFCSVLTLAVKRSPPWRQKAAGPGLSRGAAASAPRPGPLRRATPRPGCPAAFLPPFAGPSPGLARMRVPAPHREGRSPGPPPPLCPARAPHRPPAVSGPRGVRRVFSPVVHPGHCLALGQREARKRAPSRSSGGDAPLFGSVVGSSARPAQRGRAGLALKTEAFEGAFGKTGAFP